MSIEFFLELIVVIGAIVAVVWIYCAIFDFVDEWKARLRREKREAEILRLSLAARLPPMGGRYGIDHEPPTGPPDDWERRPSRPRTARMLD